MEDLPSNSHKPVQENEPTEKKVTRVVSGDVTRKKKTLGKRFGEMFFGEDTKNVGTYVVWEVLLPAVKDIIFDVVSQGVERTLFGESRSGSRRSRSSSGRGHESYVSYDRYSKNSSSSWKRDRDDHRPISRRARQMHDFDEVVIPSRQEADEVLDRLYDLISKYDSASVSDLYELVGISPSYTDDKWGWESLRGASVRRTREGYILDLPKPEPLE